MAQGPTIRLPPTLEVRGRGSVRTNATAAHRSLRYRSVCRSLTVRSGPAQFKHGLPSCHRDVFVETIVDAESEVVEHPYRRSPQWTDYGANQSRARERSQQLAKNTARRLGSQLRCFELLRFAAPRDPGLPRRSKAPDPVHLRRSRLKKAPFAEL